MLKQSLTYIIYNNVKTITILHILKIIGLSVCILKSLYIGTLVRNENLHFLSILFTSIIQRRWVRRNPIDTVQFCLPLYFFCCTTNVYVPGS